MDYKYKYGRKLANSRYKAIKGTEEYIKRLEEAKANGTTLFVGEDIEDSLWRAKLVLDMEKYC